MRSGSTRRLAHDFGGLSHAPRFPPTAIPIPRSRTPTAGPDGGRSRNVTHKSSIYILHPLSALQGRACMQGALMRIYRSPWPRARAHERKPQRKPSSCLGDYSFLEATAAAPLFHTLPRQREGPAPHDQRTNAGQLVSRRRPRCARSHRATVGLRRYSGPMKLQPRGLAAERVRKEPGQEAAGCRSNTAGEHVTSGLQEVIAVW